MNQRNAAGRNTEKTDPFEEELIATVAISREGIAKSLAVAERMTSAPVDDHWDTHDMLRAHGNAVTDAIDIIKAIAEVTLAGAKLRGEFNHTYNVTRRTEPAKVGEGVVES